MQRTDLAIEFSKGKKADKKEKDFKKTSITVDAQLSKRIGKSEGEYITIETGVVREGRRSAFEKISKQLASAISSLASEKNYLVVGLGNPDMTADSLGKRVLDKLIITRHMENLERLPSVSGIVPNVLGVTGIESFDIIKGVVDRIKPDCVIVVDSLASASVARIACAFQVSNGGITPGSGVSNHRTRLDKSSLGVPVISVGVPLVIYASTLIKDATNEKASFNKEIGDMVVTPKDVDLLVEDCAHIISAALNLAIVKIIL